MTRPDWKLLGDLVTAAEAVLRQPETAFSQRAALDLLAAEVGNAMARPAVEARSVDAAAMMLITMLRALMDAPAAGARLEWEIVTGAMVPIVRRRIWIAIEAERAAEQDRSGGTR